MSTDTMPAPRGLPGSDVLTGSDGVPRHSDRAVRCAAPLAAEPDSVASTPRDTEGLRTGTTNVRMMHLLERIAARFNNAGVPLLALKGAALNLTVHERPDERPMSDLDLLIKPDHIDRAFALLEGLEALRGEPLVREDFFPRFYYETEYAAGHIYPVRIDLHVRPFRPLRYSRLVPEDALWRRAETVRIGAAHILVPCAEDMLIHLAAHAAIHGDSRAMWRRDIKLWAEAHEGRIDWDRFLSTVEEWRLVLPVRRGIESAERHFGESCPAHVTQRLSQSRVTWRDRLALWQAPRDADHPVTHVAVNVLCTPGWRVVLAYLSAVLFPGPAHMADWYRRRHLAWLPCAYLARWLAPITSRMPLWWRWCAKIETRKSRLHGTGVFATRNIAAGELIAHYQGREVHRDGVYVVPHKAKSGQTRRYELTGKLKFLNHSCRPNARLSGFELRAVAPVNAGQEITIDYGTCDCNHKDLLDDAPTGREPDLQSESATRWSLARDRAATPTTRRAFIRGAAKKALYVTPVVMTLAASEARAGSGDFDSACGDEGSPCGEHADCCPPLMCLAATCRE